MATTSEEIYNNLTGILEQLTENSIEYYNIPFIYQNYYINKNKANGPMEAYTGWEATNYISIGNAKFLHASTNMTDNIQWNGFYDANKNFISDFSLVDKIAVPDNAVYFRLSKPKDGTVNFSIYVESLNGETKFSFVPKHYLDNNYLENKIKEINNKMNLVRNGVGFIFITDMHFLYNSRNSKYVLKNILDNTTIPFVICGGDIPNTPGTKLDLLDAANELVKYQNYIGNDRFFTIRGNHDFYNNTADGSVSNILPEKTIYNVICRNSERYMSDAMVNDMCFCIDIPIQRTRFICVNSKDVSGGVNSYIGPYQANWITQKLMEKPNYNFIIISHIPLDQTLATTNQDGSNPKDSNGNEIVPNPWKPDWDEQKIVLDILRDFKARNKCNYNHKDFNFSADFSKCTGNIVCCLAGHMHWDGAHVDEDSNITSIITTSDARYADDSVIGPRALNTVNEMACDAVIIDYDAKTINTIRVGAGANRSFTYSI